MFDRLVEIDAVDVSLISPASSKSAAPSYVGQVPVLVRLAAGSAAGLGARVCGWDAVLTGKSADVRAAERRESLHFGWPDIGAQSCDDGIDQRLAGFLVGGLGVPV